MPRKARRPAISRRKPSKVLRWRVWPAARDWRTTCALGLLLIVLWVATGLVMKQAVWVVVAVLFLGGSLLPFFGPTWYELTEDGVVVRGLLYRRTKEWSAFRGYRADEHAVLLSPFSRPSRLDTFRGVVLRLQDNREEVIAFVERKIGRPKRKARASASSS